MILPTVVPAMVVAVPALAQAPPADPDTPVSGTPGANPRDRSACERFNDQYGTEIACDVPSGEGGISEPRALSVMPNILIRGLEDVP